MSFTVTATPKTNLVVSRVIPQSPTAATLLPAQCTETVFGTYPLGNDLHVADSAYVQWTHVPNTTAVAATASSPTLFNGEIWYGLNSSSSSSSTHALCNQVGTAAWNQRFNLLPYAGYGFDVLAVDGSTLRTGLHAGYAYTASSTDGGQTWVADTYGANSAQLYGMIAFDGNVFAAGKRYGGIFHTTILKYDSGYFQDDFDTGEDYTIFALPVMSNVLYSINGGSHMHRRAAGGSWAVVNMPSSATNRYGGVLWNGMLWIFETRSGLASRIVSLDSSGNVTEKYVFPSSSYTFCSACASSGYLYVAYMGPSSTYVVARSSDGVTFTTLTDYPETARTDAMLYVAPYVYAFTKNGVNIGREI